MIRYLLIFLLSISLISVNAQQFGGFRPSIKWKQISTDTARIIFQPEVSAQAQEVAAIIHRMAAAQPNSLGNGLRKVNIVLHSNTTLANGYVALAPFRSEYYLIPTSNTFEMGTLPWHKHLAVHEYRHVQQYNNMNVGVAKVFRLLLGEEGLALANSIAVPSWFFEGDAVHMETGATLQGRGRLPYFLSGYNSLMLEGKHYSLKKMLNGSLKDYVPNHYNFGYIVVNYGYEKYGNDFWKKVINDAASFNSLLFGQSIKKYSGVSGAQFINDALKHYQQQLTPVKDNTCDKRQNKTVTNYYFAQFIGKDSLLYLKDSYKQLPAFFIKDKQGEHLVKLKSISSEDWFSYRKGVIAYTAYSTDARWPLQNYSDIVLLDMHTKKEQRLTRKHKYYTPDVSPSGSRLAAIFINDSTNTELHILDAVSGSVIKTFSAQPKTYLQHPRFIDEDNLVLLQRTADGIMNLQKMNLITGATETLQTAGYNVLAHPFVQGDTVFFTSSASGNDELYALKLKDNKTFQLTSGQTGNYYVSATSENIAWAHFTAFGLQSEINSLQNMLWREIDAGQLNKQVAIHPVAEKVDNVLNVPERRFSVSSYPKSTRLFNFHSWRPFYEDPEFSFTMYSDNILNTFSNQLYYRYNQNESSHAVGFNTIYGGWFPQLTAGVQYTFGRHVISNHGPLLLDELEAKAGYFIPLDFTKGKTYKNFGIGSNFVWRKLTSKTKDIKLANSTAPYMQNYFSFAQQLPRAPQHIYPKLGYSLNGLMSNNIKDNGYRLNVNGQIYLPSFGNHSLVLSGAFQQYNANGYAFDNRFANARGYEETDSAKMWRASVNYHFPIAYPDRGIPLLYFMRIRGNVFYDFSKAYGGKIQQSGIMRSTGAELYFDTKFWNYVPITLGFRYSYLLDEKFAVNRNRHSWEIVLPVSLIPN